jgi:DHA3 family macrolide efflux protein-like MFS transporter
LKNSRAIFLLLLANSISGVAQGISMLAIPWYFTAVIHRETLFGWVYLAITSVSLIWGLYAGTLVDRYSRKKIFLVVNLVGLFVLTCISVTGYVRGSLPWYLVAMAFANTVFIYNIHFPNLYAYAQEITPRENYSRITSLLEIQGQLTFAISGGAAAILLKGFGGHVQFSGLEFNLPFSVRPWKIYEVFSVDAATYFIAFAIIYRIRSLPVFAKIPDTSGLAERVRTGFSFLKKHRLIFIFGNASLTIFLTIIVMGTYIQPVYVDSFLHRGGGTYALSDMAFSIGALLAGFLTTRVFGEKSAIPGIIVLSLMVAGMYVFMAFNTVVILFFMANFIIGACNAAIRIQRITYLFHHIPNHVIGRANSIFFVINVFFRMCLIGVLTLPVFHSGTNTVLSMALLAAICCAGAFVLVFHYKKLMLQPEIPQ